MGISRRSFLKTATATAAAATSGRTPCESGGRAEGTGRLNLLWIMTDQQPVSMVAAYGKAGLKTPHLDRIAAEGMRFDRFHIAAFPCSPSRSCFLTGRYSHNHGVIQNDVPLADSVPALGDILKDAGYATGFAGKWHLSGHMYRNQRGRKPYDGVWYYERVPNKAKFEYTKVRGGAGEDQPQHGFDQWVGGWKHYRDYLREAGLGELVAESSVGNHNDLPSGPEGTHIYSKLPEEHHMAAFLAGEAEQFLEAQKDSADPFALVLSFYGPHLPVAPPKPWDEMYPLEEVPLPPNHHDDLEGKPVRQLTNGRCYKQPEWEEKQFRDYVRRYWGYCSYIDHQIGRVLAALEASGKAGDTIVLFTSDHGDMLAAHGFVFKLGHCGYDELLRVPFLLRCPGRIEAGSTSDALVSSVDVLPTLLEMMRVPAPETLDGRSFVPLLRGEAEKHREALVCNSAEHNLTIVSTQWKYVLNWDPRDLDELYDLVADPGEKANLAADPAHAAVVSDLRTKLMQWLEETGHPYRHSIAQAMRTPPEPWK